MSGLSLERIQEILSSAPFAAEDRALADYLVEFEGEVNPWICLAAGMTMASARDGSACLDLKSIPLEILDFLEGQSLTWPELQQWEAWLQASSSVGADGSYAPLIYTDSNLLYLNRYYEHEKYVVAAILRKCEAGPESAIDKDSGGTQDEAVQRALTRIFTIVTGGPGTGKTTLALRFLRDWLTPKASIDTFRLAAVAPTGKAAARLAESFSSGLQRLQIDPEVRESLQNIPCLTIHRLLGIGTLGKRPKFDARHPLDLDVLIVDECSMIDLPLMRHLLDAVPDDCSLLMLGDSDQLSSVQVGSVFKDLVESSERPESPLNRSVSKLTKTYRFSGDSQIFRTCEAARQGDFEAWSKLLLENNGGEEVSFSSVDSQSKHIPPSLLSQAHSGYAHLKEAKSPEEALSQIKEFIVLTPTNDGVCGARQLNQSIHSAFHSDSLDAPRTPIIIRQNDYNLELYNGDVGVIWSDEQTEVPQAVFLDKNGAARSLPLALLPHYELAYVITIHKSQGSEYSHVCVAFHPSETRILSRELMYTAFSRARIRLSIFSNPEVMREALGRKVKRASGLSQKLACEISSSTH